MEPTSTLLTDVTSIVDVVKAVMSLFSEFPLNIIIASMIGGIGFQWFTKAKHAAK